jgi:hypothetical protein
MFTAALPTPLRAGPLWARCLGAALLTVLSIDTAGATPNPIAGRIVSPGALAVGPLSSQAPDLGVLTDAQRCRSV